MRLFAPLAGIAALCAALAAAAAPADTNPAVKAAAERFIGGIQWQAQSVLTADFSCAGKRQNAILGTSDKEIVVALFTQGLARPPEVLRFAGEGRKPGAAKIRLDDITLTPDEVRTLAGALPPGYRPSASCKGVRLSDDASDAAHIYWDHEARRFDSWTQQG